MRFEFTYTPEDIAELMVPESHVRNPRRHVPTIWRAALTSLVVPAMLSGFGALVWYADRQMAPFRPENPPQDLIVELLPSYLAAFLVFALYVTAFWKAWRNSRSRTAVNVPKRNAIVRFMIPFGFGVGLWWGVSALLHIDPHRGPQLRDSQARDSGRCDDSAPPGVASEQDSQREFSRRAERVRGVAQAGSAG